MGHWSLHSVSLKRNQFALHPWHSVAVAPVQSRQATWQGRHVQFAELLKNCSGHPAAQTEEFCR